jgi:hypothetical protein
MRCCKLLDRVERERRQFESMHPGPGAKLANQQSQRMIAVELIIAISPDHQAGNGLHAAAEEPQNVQSCFICPVQILDDDYRGFARTELLGEGGKDRLRLTASLDDLPERALRRCGNVYERPKWPRRVKSLTGAPQDARHARTLVTEALNESGLADTGLARDEDKPPPPGSRICQALVQLSNEQ